MVRRRRWLRWALAGVAILVVAAVGGPFVYIHFIEGKAPAKLTLPPSQTGSSGSGADVAAATPIAGVWKVGAGSIVGYRVQEELVGQSNTAVGRTSEVWGSLTITRTTVTSGSFTANLSSVTSNESQRDAQFDGRIMDVSTFPTATFKLSDPIQLGTIPSAGEVKQFAATGQLTMHGVTRTIHVAVSAERSGSALDVLADIPITFADWNIANPSLGGFVTTQNTGTLEVLLNLTENTGNQPSPALASGNSQGFGGPVTVPATTVPPLTVPSKSG